ncbi:type IV secretion system protein [Pseudomonas sp. JG-B]|uniref:type IV secretion system protein n=1 Tax=Pseudomonas sp. JG-B TaxID=2603214 RepID=UPI00129DB0CA|nr:type IV secretion system protein [Pseudomonas sp. JG-B]MRK19088.1 conjugal transfer protein [Pseudomonas sp. JG-B]
MASDFKFYSRSFAELTSMLNSYITDVAGNVIGSITPVATQLLVLYIALWGYAMMRGMISEPWGDGAQRLIRLSMITALALNVGRYNSYFVEFLWNAPDRLAAIVAGSSYGSVSNIQFLDRLMSQMYDLGDAYWQKAYAGASVMPDLGMIFTAWAIWLCGLAVTAYGAFLLALSKMALAVLLAIGPIYVLMMIFEGTKKFFESWIGQTLNYGMLVVLTAAVIRLILTILNMYLGALDSSGAVADPSISQALPAVALSAIGVLVMMQLSTIASALGGGVAVSTMGAAGAMWNKAKGAAGQARDVGVR